MSYFWSVILVEALLAAGMATRVFTLYLEGQFSNFSFSRAFDHWFHAGKEDDIHTERDREEIKTLHILTATVVHVFLLPQLYMLVLVGREKTTIVFQFIFVLLLILYTGVTQGHGLHSILQHTQPCDKEGTCVHKSWSWFLFTNLLVFVSIIMVRLMFHTRCKSWLLGVRVVGPLLDFMVSRKVREYQGLCLLLALSATTVSGFSVLSDRRSIMGGLTVGVAVADLISSFLTLAGLLGLVSIYLLTHYGHSHRRVVPRSALEAALLGLAEEHAEVLQGDTRISSVKYSPFTKSCSPGASEQRLNPNQDWLKDVM